MATARARLHGGRPRLHDGLSTSLALGTVASVVRQHAASGASAVYRALRADPSFALLLGASTSAFAVLAASQHARLAQRTRADAKGESKAGPAAVTWHDAKSGGKRKRYKVDGSFFKQLAYLLRIAFGGRNATQGGPLLAAQMLLLLMRTQITVKTTKINVYYLTKAISQASWEYWVKWLAAFSGWTMSGMAVNTGLKYTEAMIQVHIRQALTRRAHALYLSGNAFYSAAVLRKGGLDAIDQHIAADIDAFSKHAANIYGHSFKPALEFVLSLREASKDLGYARVLAVFALNGVVGSVLRAVSPKAGRMVAKEAELEGTFRHAHSRLIANSEEVAFLRGQGAERAILDSTLTRLVDTQAGHQLTRIKKSLADQFLKFFGLLSGGVFVHVPFLMRDDMSAGERISAFRSTEEQMLKCGNAFTEVMLLSTNLQELAGYTQRMYTMMRALEKMSKEEQQGSAVSTGERIDFDGVTVMAPDVSSETGKSDRTLVKALSLTVDAGKSVLVTGPNGAGKTSLFRVLAGLWAPTEGSAAAPPPEELLWLPQRPYLVMGTLRDQVAYPRLLGYDSSEDAHIEEALRMAGLGNMVVRAREAQEARRKADAMTRSRRNRAKVPGCQYAPLSLIHEEWADVLSGGERQRMGFARLYFHRPKFAVLDEATSAINPDEESSLYEKLCSSTTVLSIAHRLELRKFHDRELRIVGDGTGAWELKPLA